MKRTERSSSGVVTGLVMGLALIIGGCASSPQGGGTAAAPAAAPKSAAAVAGPAKAAPGYKYVCNCGSGCNCDTTADKPGNCTCGKPMTYKKILREDSSYYWVCSCQGCNCDALSKDDPFKCSCGKPLQAISKKGRYVCGCGQGCDCGTASQNMGNCVCGKPMKAAP